MATLSRRQLLRRSATLAAGAILADLLAACGSAPTPTPEPAAAPAAPPTETPWPTAEPTAVPTPMPTVRPRPEAIKWYPDVPSTVVRTRHPGAWDGDKLLPEVARRMLDASITALTGLTDVKAAWASLFRPDERIAIKVNAFQNSLIWTNVPLVSAVTDSLQEAGIPAEQIVLYDAGGWELKAAGFTVNEGGPGVQCIGVDSRTTGGWKTTTAPVRFGDVLLGCDALINMPILKSHSMSGITFALKNHYGSVSNPGSLHPMLARTISQLNALPPIKDRSRLIIGDMLKMCLKEAGSWPYWRETTLGDTIVVSYDPVAVDTLALRMFSETISGTDLNPAPAQGKANPWLAASAELGLGTNDDKNIKLVEVALE